MPKDMKFKILADPTQALNTVENLDKQLKALGGGKKLAAGAGILALGAAVAGTTAAVVSSIKTFSKFSSSISTAKAVLKPTAKELTDLTTKARLLGETTAFSASQAADAFTELGKLGLSANQILQASGDVLNFAAASGLELADAASIAAKTMNIFNLEASDMGRISDIIAKASTESAINANSFGEAIKMAGTTAKGFNVTLEETTAMMSVLANAGLEGTIAGTGMSQMFVRLNESGTKLSKKLKDLGVANGSIEEKMDALSEAGLSATEVYDLFGRIAAKSVLPLLSSADAIDEMTVKLEGAEGASKRMAKTMLDNIGGDVKIMKSAFEGMQISIGLAFGPATRKIIQTLGKEFGKASKFIEDNEDAISAFADGLGDFASFLIKNAEVLALQGILTALGAVVIAAPMAATAIAGMGVSINVALPQLLILSGAVTALNVAFNKLVGDMNDETDHKLQQAMWTKDADKVKEVKKALEDYSDIQKKMSGEGLLEGGELDKMQELEATMTKITGQQVKWNDNFKIWTIAGASVKSMTVEILKGQKKITDETGKTGGKIDENIRKMGELTEATKLMFDQWGRVDAIRSAEDSVNAIDSSLRVMVQKLSGVFDETLDADLITDEHMSQLTSLSSKVTSTSKALEGLKQVEIDKGDDANAEVIAGYQTQIDRLDDLEKSMVKLANSGAIDTYVNRTIASMDRLDDINDLQALTAFESEMLSFKKDSSQKSIDILKNEATQRELLAYKSFNDGVYTAQQTADMILAINAKLARDLKGLEKPSLFETVYGEDYQTAVGTYTSQAQQINGIVRDMFSSMNEAKENARQVELSNQEKAHRAELRNFQGSGRARRALEAKQAKEIDDIKRKQFEKEKKNKVQSIWLNAWVNSDIAFGQAVAQLGFPAGPIVGGITKGAMMTSAAIAASQANKAEYFATGGVVGGITGGKQGPDNRNIVAGDNEAIITVAQQKRFMDFMTNPVRASEENNTNGGVNVSLHVENLSGSLEDAERVKNILFELTTKGVTSDVIFA